MINNKALLVYGTIEDFSLENANVSYQRRKKIEAFRFEEDKKRCALSELLLKLALEQLGIDTGEIVYRYNDYGKPYLRDCSNLYFSISHSGKYAVCIVANNEIGIDIEFIKPVKPDIAKRFFTEAEYTRIVSDRNEKVYLDRFYDCWTKKEAYIKYIGSGLSCPLDSFNVYDMDSVKFEEIAISGNYKCSVCTEKKIESLDVLDIQKL